MDKPTHFGACFLQKIKKGFFLSLSAVEETIRFRAVSTQTRNMILVVPLCAKIISLALSVRDKKILESWGNQGMTANTRRVLTVSNGPAVLLATLKAVDNARSFDESGKYSTTLR